MAAVKTGCPSTSQRKYCVVVVGRGGADRLGKNKSKREQIQKQTEFKGTLSSLQRVLLMLWVLWCWEKYLYGVGRTIYLLCLTEDGVLFQVRPSLCLLVPTVFKIFQLLPFFFFNLWKPHTDTNLGKNQHTLLLPLTHTLMRTHSSAATRSLQVLINHPAVIPSWQLKLTSSWMGENKRPSSGPFPDTFIQSRPDCLRQHQQLFRLHLSPFDKACQVIFL